MSCSLYEGVFPMNDKVYGEVLALSASSTGEAEGEEKKNGPFWKPFAADVRGLNFTRQCEEPRGRWHNFFVGVVGEVSTFDDGEACQDALWPNRVRFYTVEHNTDS